MSSDYPGAVDSFRTLTNVPGVTYAEEESTVVFAEDSIQRSDAIVAIETTLGINPQGDSDTVADRIQAIEDGGGGGGGDGLPYTDDGTNGREIFIDYLGGLATSHVLFDVNATFGGTVTLHAAPTTDLQAATKKYVDDGLDTKQDDLGFTAVPNTRTVNGHALSANVSVSASDVGLGSVTNDAQLKASQLDTDGSLAAESDTRVASQKAVKTYVDGEVGSGVEHIAGGSIGSVASFSITSIPAKYRNLILILRGISNATATRYPIVQISVNNGTSFLTTGYMSEYGEGAGVDNTCIARAPAAVAAARSYTAFLEFTGYQTNAATICKAYWQTDDGSEWGNSHGMYVGGSSAVNALKVLWNGSGNFDAGSYDLYGVL